MVLEEQQRRFKKILRCFGFVGLLLFCFFYSVYPLMFSVKLLVSFACIIVFAVILLIFASIEKKKIVLCSLKIEKVDIKGWISYWKTSVIILMIYVLSLYIYMRYNNFFYDKSDTINIMINTRYFAERELEIIVIVLTSFISFLFFRNKYAASVLVNMSIISHVAINFLLLHQSLMLEDSMRRYNDILEVIAVMVMTLLLSSMLLYFISKRRFHLLACFAVSFITISLSIVSGADLFSNALFDINYLFFSKII